MKINKKIFAVLVILNLSFYSVFAEREEGENEGQRRVSPTAQERLFCPTTKTIIRRGHKGDEVKTIQKILREKLNLSDNDLLVTGSFGKVTEKYIKEFQKRNNILPTGMVGNLTRKKIYENCVPAPIETPSSTSTTTPVTLNGRYKDGTYVVNGIYNSPGGLDNINYSITLKKDKVSNIVVTNGANDRTSKFYQNDFIASIPSVVVGKDLLNLKIGVVSGASLTSQSFNDALSKIRTQALN